MNIRTSLPLRRSIALLLLSLLPALALADDTVAGAASYAASCANCHGSNPLTSNSNKIYNGRNARAVIDSGISSVGQMNSLRSSFPSGGAALANVAAYLGNSPNSLAFPGTAVGSTAATKSITISASLKTGNSISGLSVSTSGDFARSGGTCGTAVAVGSSCTVLVSFTPTASGARSGTLNITHAATLTPIAFALSGSGTVSASPVATMSATSLTLPSTTVNTTSGAQTLTLSNTGTAPLAIATLSLSGGNAGDFLLGAGGTCTAGASLAPSSSCTILVSFAPSAAGVRSATLGIAHNAPGSPTTVALSGTGTAVATPVIALNATTLDLGSLVVGTTSGSKSITVTNSGGASLTFSAFTSGGPAASDFTRGGTCATASSLAAAATCTLTFTFTPAAAGTRGATLTMASNASNGSAVVTLGGTGTLVPTPAVSLSATSLAFGNQTVGTASGAHAITMTNNGSAALGIGGITSNNVDFAVSGTCGSALAAGAACTISTTFTASQQAAETGTLSIASNAPTSPNTVSLGGTGVTSAPALSWSSSTTTLSFGDVAVGSSSASQTLTLDNTGTAAATLVAITLTGAASADFSLGNGTCAANGSLAAGGSCTMILSFVPTAAGSRSATLSVASGGAGPPAVALSGTGSAATATALGVAPTALDFSAASGVAAGDQTLTLQNTGTAVLDVTGIAVDSASFTLGAASSNACAAPPFSLLPGASCAVAVAWTNTTGTDSGNVLITSNAPGGSTTVAIAATHTTAGGTGSLSNAGGGGCSIADGDTPGDPVLWSLVLMAGAALWRRRR